MTNHSTAKRTKRNNKKPSSASHPLFIFSFLKFLSEMVRVFEKPEKEPGANQLLQQRLGTVNTWWCVSMSGPD